MPNIDSHENGIILGGGIAGLLCGYKLKLPVITVDLGGQLNTSFPLGPRILEKTEETDQLLEELCIDAKPREYHIGYYSDRLYSRPPEGFREKYYLKTRGRSNPSSSSMSSNRNVIIGYDLDEIDLLSQLIPRCKIIRRRIGEINDLEKYIRLDPMKKIIQTEDSEEPSYWSYNTLISTIPLYNYIGLTGHYINLQALDTYFFYVETNVDATRGFDYIYIANEGPIHRVTRIEQNRYVFESTSGWALSCLGVEPGYMPSGSLLDYDCVRYCQIVDSLGVRELNGTHMVGRYAQWDHGVKIDTILRRLNNEAFIKQMGRIH